MLTQAPTSAQYGSPHLEQVLRQLERLGRRARLLLVSRRALGLVAAAVGVAALAVALDWVFRFPAWFRLIGLLLGMGFFASAAWRLLVPAWRFRPTSTELALRVERSAPALQGRLASAVEFALSDAGRESELARRAMADLEERLAGESLLAWLAPKRSLAELSTALMTLATVGAVAGLLPSFAAIGSLRILMPIIAAEWPARTAVESLIAGQGFHAQGAPLLLQARLTKGDAEGERVMADITVTREDGSVINDSIVLTRQPDGRYERVLDGDQLAAHAEVRFRSADSESEVERIAFVAPPVVVTSEITVEPPEYARGDVDVRHAELGDGTGSRGALRDAVLVGSMATLRLQLNAPLGSDAEWIRTEMVRFDDAPDDSPQHSLDRMPELTIDTAMPNQWTLRWRVARSSTLRLALRDAHGIGNVDEIAFRIEASTDRPPIAAVLVPAADESVLATALVPVEIEGRDDVALSRFGLVTTRKSTGNSGGASGEPSGNEALGDSVGEVSASAARRNEVLDLGALAVRPGDVLTLVAAAEDDFELDGQRHQRVLSGPRTIRIISDVDLGKQLRAQLSTIRRAAIRMEEQQSEMLAATANRRFDAALERGQAQLSERLRSASESFEDLAERVERNRLTDAELQATLDQARDLVETASRASSEASAGMQALRQAESGEEAQARAGAEVEAAQESVRAELEDLVRLLDRDEDSWAMGRAIDQLREELGKLSEQTTETGKRTVGQRTEELTPDDQAALEGLATRQREAAQDAQELLDDLRKRAESVERTDRARAEAMREAARMGEESRLQRNLEQAGDEIQRNRIEQARANQEEAMQALSEMRRGIDDVRRARAEELRRALESLEQSIDRLIRMSEDEIIALARVGTAEDNGGAAERGRSMAKLSQNTRAIASEARAAGSEANSVARLLDRAADSQGAAVSHLRAASPNLVEAKAAEERGLAFLKDARSQSQRTREQIEAREEDRKRKEMVMSYRRLHEKQVSVRDGTLVARPKGDPSKLDRRALIESRRLAIVQGEVRTDLDAVLRDQMDVRSSQAFSQAHELLGGWASEASERLSKGDLSDGTVGLQNLVIETLQEVVEALNEEANEEPEQFKQNPNGEEQPSGGSGGGSGKQPAIPPVAELKLIRALQIQILARTRAVDRLRAEGATTGEAAETELRAIAKLQSVLLKTATEVVRKIESSGSGSEAPPSQGSDDAGDSGDPHREEGPNSSGSAVEFNGGLGAKGNGGEACRLDGSWWKHAIALLWAQREHAMPLTSGRGVRREIAADRDGVEGWRNST
jgi:hypothetical protein